MKIYIVVCEEDEREMILGTFSKKEWAEIFKEACEKNASAFSYYYILEETLNNPPVKTIKKIQEGASYWKVKISKKTGKITKIIPIRWDYYWIEGEKIKPVGYYWEVYCVAHNEKEAQRIALSKVAKNLKLYNNATNAKSETIGKKFNQNAKNP